MILHITHFLICDTKRHLAAEAGKLHCNFEFSRATRGLLADERRTARKTNQLNRGKEKLEILGKLLSPNVHDNCPNDHYNELNNFD